MLRNVVLRSVVCAAMIAGFARTASADPALGQKWVAYGNQLMAAKDYDKALQAFSTAARADAKSAAAWKGLGSAYYYKKDYANAAKYYKYSFQLNPSDAALGAFIPKLEAAAATPASNSPADAAAGLYQARRYDEAITAYTAALTANPNDAKAWQGLGNCFYAKQDKPKAVEAYKHALQLNPSNTSLQNFLASYAPDAAGGAAGTQVADGPRDWAQPLWRSAVLPGWGQGYNGESTKGWLLGGATLGLLAGTVVTYVMGDAARVQYNGLTDPNADYDTPYSTWESMANINHICYIGFGVAYTFTLVDAIVSAKHMPKTSAYFKEEAPAMQVSMLDPAGAFGVKYRLLQF